MAMTDMNVAPDYDSPITMGNCPRLYLSEAQCEALGITTPPAAGMKMSMSAIVKVVSVTSSDDGDEAEEGGPDVCLTLEVSAMELGTASSGTSLYD